MKRVLLTISWLVVSSIALAEDMSVSDFLARKNKQETVEYVAGLGEGMDFLNHRAGQLGRELVFCVPKDLKLNAGNYMNILMSEIAKEPKRNTGLMPLASVMANGLIRTFPCK